MHDDYECWLILGACLTVGCEGGAVDLGGSDASGWFDAPSQAADSTRPQTLYEGEAEIVSLAVDETTLYALLDHGEQGYELVSCPIDRCRSERSTLSSFYSRDSSPGQTPLVRVADRLYWIASWDSSGGVASCSLAGCETPDLVPSPIRGGFAGDDAHVYWIDQIDDQCWLNRLGPGSPEPEKVRDLDLRLYNNGPFAVAGDHVYFVDVSSLSTLNARKAAGIYRVRKDGSEAATPFATFTIDERVGGIGVTTEALYYTTSTLAGTIVSCPLAGCDDQRRAIATNQRWPSRIQIDDSEAFWINTVRRSSSALVSLSSCRLPECSTINELAADFPLGGQVAINRAFVLWVEDSAGGGLGSALRRLAR